LPNHYTETLVPDPQQIVILEHLEQAEEILIERNDTHLDSLAERLRELRIRRIMEPMLAGEDLGEVPYEDLRFVVDSGLGRIDPPG